MKCPVCVNETFPCNDYEFKICKECFWEYDPAQGENPDYTGGANCQSRNGYRKINEDLKSCKPGFSCKKLDDIDLIIRLDHMGR